VLVTDTQLLKYLGFSTGAKLWMVYNQFPDAPLPLSEPGHKVKRHWLPDWDEYFKNKPRYEPKENVQTIRIKASEIDEDLRLKVRQLN